MKGYRLEYTAAASDEGKFLRDVLRSRLLLSRALVVRLKYQGRISVNGVTALTSRCIRTGDIISIDMDFTEESNIVPEAAPLDIVYEDDDFLVVNKPAGIFTHPSQRGGTGSLANAVAHYWHQSGRRALFRPINRLDRDTSGLVLIGKSQYAHQGIFRLQKRKAVERWYTALADGVLETDSGVIDRPIALIDERARRRTVDPSGKAAVTFFQVMERFTAHTLLLLKLGTGRTHQIRVHLSSLGHPVCGDRLYGKPSPLIDRQALHAGHMSFNHPRSGKTITLDIPPSPDIQAALHRLQALHF